MRHALAEFDELHSRLAHSTLVKAESHTVKVEGTNTNELKEYAFLVDGTASPSAKTSDTDLSRTFGRWTAVTGFVSGGYDEWAIDGGIVAAQVTGGDSYNIYLDDTQVTTSELVSNTGGVHPDDAALQCQSNGDCAGDLICDSNKCAIPSGYPQCSTNDECNGDLICDNGSCVVPSDFPQCESDSDCAGDLLCDDGKCIAPPEIEPEPEPEPQPGCTSDADCPGRMVCENGECVEPEVEPPEPPEEDDDERERGDEAAPSIVDLIRGLLS